jgi:ABC-type siderophore export system fused ATPase/permease subunit
MNQKEKIAYYESLLSGRAGKLLKKGKFFLVVAEDEPYFRQVYEMIREHEKQIGRWTEEDEEQFEGRSIPFIEGL